MMIHKTLRLRLSDEDVKQLKERFGKVIKHLEKNHSLKAEVMEELKTALSTIVKDDPEWQDVLAGLRGSGDFYCVHLLHEDNEILNLPWAMAIDNISGKPLGQIEQLVLAKGITTYYKERPGEFTRLAPPLKILIMISSPEDSSWKHRLSYEEEEFEILKAFAPLMQAGLVEIDFTGDGSLDTLKQKLGSTRYHILHYSGHAGFNEKMNDYVLEMEDPVSLNHSLVIARDFADGINCRPDYRVPMVVLSSCQTAQGSVEKGLQGITSELMRAGFPVVISMGMSILDRYAALFTARLYEKMAEQWFVVMAFADASRFLHAKEFQDKAAKGDLNPRPLQWIIPNLYLSGPFEGIIDWSQAPQKQHYSSNRYIFEKDKLLLAHDTEYLFIGRRKDKARILKPFLAKQPILLKGQGGVGKTALAEHLVQRLVAADPQIQPFVFNEKHRSIDDILKAMKNYFLATLQPGVITALSLYESGMEKFAYLLSGVVKNHRPVFVFDNLESFQVGPGKEFSPEYGDIKEIIDFLCDTVYGQFHVILTCRYPVQGVKNVNAFDLNQVGLNDFWKKCYYMDVGHINNYLWEAEAVEKKHGVSTGKKIAFIYIVNLLHQVFGGNFRCLEFFNLVLKESPAKIRQSLDTLEHFLESSKEEVDRVREQMGKNLLFEQLLALLDAGQQGVLGLLAQFRVPVQQWALELQIQANIELNKNFCGSQGAPRRGEPIENLKKSPLAVGDNKDLLTLLAGLQRLTLIEVSLDGEVGIHYYYVTPLVRDLLANAGETAGSGTMVFDHEWAGLYFYNAARNMDGGVTDGEEGFYHYDRAGNLNKVEEIGGELSRFYYTYSMFHSAFFYANRIYELKGGETAGVILNLLGAIYHVYGDYDRSLDFYKKAQVAIRMEGDKEGEGVLLNNIGQIYKVQGDYDTALHYLGKCLKIFQEIEDKKNEGATLNNISQIYDTRGDYDTALQYLEQSLKISQEIGDKFGEGVRLNNIGQIYKVQGDNNSALHYLEQSLKISQELGDRAGEGTTLNNISYIYVTQGDFDTALHYLEQSLAISQEIGDISGMANNLHSMAAIAFKKENIKKYMEYDTEAYRLALETGNAFYIYRIGANLGTFLLLSSGSSESRESALAMLRKSLDIGKKAGYPDVGELEELVKKISEHDLHD